LQKFYNSKLKKIILFSVLSFLNSCTDGKSNDNKVEYKKISNFQNGSISCGVSEAEKEEIESIESDLNQLFKPDEYGILSKKIEAYKSGNQYNLNILSDLLVSMEIIRRKYHPSHIGGRQDIYDKISGYLDSLSKKFREIKNIQLSKDKMNFGVHQFEEFSINKYTIELKAQLHAKKFKEIIAKIREKNNFHTC
jgi:hypothetical protein